MKESSSVVILGLAIDIQLTFKSHINVLCHRASSKLHALRKKRKCLTAELNYLNTQLNYLT